MRKWIPLFRVLVGVLFIISGLVKANDPLGLAYKMQEFFEVWVSDLQAAPAFLKNSLVPLIEAMHPAALPLSIAVITLEIVAGMALLLGWQPKLVTGLLLVLIVFFTFLTGYAYGSGKFKNCGCFGDCLPIPPLASFVKDLVLLALILVLLAGRRYITHWKPAAAKMILAATLVLSIALQWYVLNNLPIADCLPFKKGADIVQGLKIPVGAQPDSFAIRFVYEKEGKQYEFPADGLPADLATYKFIDRVDKLVRKGNAEPPIKGFALTGVSGTDSTQAILALPKAALIITERLTGKEPWLLRVKKLLTQAQTKNIPFYLATAASLPRTRQLLDAAGMGALPIFSLDFTAVRTAARTQPTIYLLQKGVVIDKLGAAALPKAHTLFQR